MPELRNARVLVTGGAGFIGSHLVDLLRAEHNADVVILDNLEPQTHRGQPPWLPKDARFIHGDVRNPQDLRQALEGVRFVFHLAAFGGFTDAASKYLDVNATGTARLYETIFEHRLPVEKIVVASSQGVYGEGAYTSPSGELLLFVPFNRPLDQLRRRQWEHLDSATGQPLTPVPTPVSKPADTRHVYAVAKLAAERAALTLGRQWHIPTCALRFAVTFGPRQSIYNPYTGIASIFSTQILNGQRPQVYEDGNQTRDFLYVEDNVRGNLFAMEHEETTDGIFNLATGRATSVRELVLLLSELLEAPCEPLTPGYFRPTDVRHLVLDRSPLADLGFQPKFSLREGLERFVAWIREQPDVQDLFTGSQQRLIDSGVVHVANG
jgi:dTDP-L-rhamnose 4-epimerase